MPCEYPFQISKKVSIRKWARLMRFSPLLGQGNVVCLASFPGSPSFRAISTRMTFDPAERKEGEIFSRDPRHASIPNVHYSFTQHVAAVTRRARSRNAKATALPRWRASLKWAENSSRIYSRDRKKTGGSS